MDNNPKLIEISNEGPADRKPSIKMYSYYLYTYC